MSHDGVSRRYFFFGSLLAGAVPLAGQGSVPSLRALGYKPFYDKLNVAAVGCGFFAGNHFNSWNDLKAEGAELVALKGAKLQYITVQNWSANVFNLVTKRGIAHEDAEVKWIDCNIGSRLTMKYPGVIMKGRRARGDRPGSPSVPRTLPGRLSWAAARRPRSR